MPKKFIIQTEETFDRALEGMRIATGRTEDIEVIIDALEFWDLVVSEAKKGKSVHIGGREVGLPHLMMAQGRTPRLKLVLNDEDDS